MYSDGIGAVWSKITVTNNERISPEKDRAGVTRNREKNRGSIAKITSLEQFVCGFGDRR
jgi:hypothetical protein